ncbi:hypothetical protein T4D_1419 [Trichinella pseudospiralis]|uniref:Uncharacterized protein n=1 Tax=Trichinella pseudospiralis TaxID=6337 RepID=A0A0V1FD69_TRIPS|nr:hypothetical protein T4D_1419 [Trichinella pseudospiralis]
MVDHTLYRLLSGMLEQLCWTGIPTVDISRGHNLASKATRLGHSQTVEDPRKSARRPVKVNMTTWCFYWQN